MISGIAPSLCCAQLVFSPTDTSLHVLSEIHSRTTIGKTTLAKYNQLFARGGLARGATSDHLGPSRPSWVYTYPQTDGEVFSRFSPRNKGDDLTQWSLTTLGISSLPSLDNSEILLDIVPERKSTAQQAGPAYPPQGVGSADP